MDGILLDIGSGGANLLTDEITTGANSGQHAQRSKIVFGGDGVFQDVGSATPFPVDFYLPGGQIPSTNSGNADAGTQRVIFSANQDPIGVQGGIAHDAIDSGRPVKFGGHAYFDVPTPVADDDRVDAMFSTRGALAIAGVRGGTHVANIVVNSGGNLMIVGSVTASQGDPPWSVFESGTVDGFGHLIMGMSHNQVDVQFFRDTPANLVSVTVAGGGATSQVGGSGQFETSAAVTASAKGESATNVIYRSGAEIFCLFTALFTTPTHASTYQRIGLYNTTDGFFVGFEGTSFGVTARLASSDTTVAQASFSEDALTGAVGSKFTRAGSPEAIDPTKFNVFRVRFGWLGSATVFWEVLSPDGIWVNFHKILQPNLATAAIVESPDLPVTVDVSKTAADATNLIVRTSCWGAGISVSDLPLDETLTDDTLAPINRSVIAGKSPGGTYINVGVTNGGNFKIDVEDIGGTAISVNSGNTDGGTQRVILASDQPAVPVDGSGFTQPVSGTVGISSFPDNEPFDLNLVGGAAIAVNSGPATAGTQRVFIATDQPALAVQSIDGIVSISGTPNVAVTSFPADQPFDVNLIGGAAVAVNSGNADAGTQRIILASDQPVIPVQGTDAVGAPAADSPVQMGAEARTTLPTAVDDADVVRPMADDLGRVIFTRDAPRDLTTQNHILLIDNAETLLIAAGGAGVFRDITDLTGSNESSTKTRIEFRQNSGGPVNFSMVLAADGGGFTKEFNRPLMQTSGNTAWTAKLTVSVNTVAVYASAVDQN